MKFLWSLLAILFRENFLKTLTIERQLLSRILSHLLSDFYPVRSHDHEHTLSIGVLKLFSTMQNGGNQMRIASAMNYGDNP